MPGISFAPNDWQRSGQGWPWRRSSTRDRVAHRCPSIREPCANRLIMESFDPGGLVQPADLVRLPRREILGTWPAVRLPLANLREQHSHAHSLMHLLHCSPDLLGRDGNVDMPNSEIRQSITDSIDDRRADARLAHVPGPFCAHGVGPGGSYRTIKFVG